jgi:hypothetical protein
VSDTYNVYAYFWSDSSNWKLAADLTDNVGGDLPLYSKFSGASVTDSGASIFTTAVLTSESGRTLWQASLGQVSGTSISVYLDDDPAQADANGRTWLDGIGYEVIPEPATLGLVGIFGAGALFVRRRFMI